MASNQTSNYGLNQWEAADQVLRTDFNADNSKIDDALKELTDRTAAEAAARKAADQELNGKVGLQIIKTAIQETDSTVFEIDLSDMDWSQWSTIYICLDLQGNGHYRISYGTYYDQGNTIPISGKYTLVFWPMYQASASMGGILFGYSTPKFLAPGGYAYDNFSKLLLGCPEPTYAIKKGSRITVLGGR